MDNTKICSHCKIDKPFSAFHKCKTGKFGLKNYCKLCSQAKAQEHYDENKENILDNVLTWRKENSDKYKKYQEKYRRKKEEKE